jgi:uncharacterized protein with PIN domain
MKFIVDRMLGKLVKGLRMLGYDTVYYQGENAHQLISMARREGRMILTRNRKLIPKKPEDRILQVKEDNPSLQLKKLVQEGHVMLDEEKLFSRCLLCNVPLIEIQREEAQGRVPDFILHQQEEFFQCPHCQRIYWPGSHQENMQKRVKELLQVKYNIKCQSFNSK